MTLLMSGGLTIAISAIVFLLITLVLVIALLYAKTKLVPSGNIKVVVNGEKEFEAIAVYAGTEQPGYPCGGCRQVFSDLAPNVLWLLVGDKEVKIETLESMLPNRFVLEDLRR